MRNRFLCTTVVGFAAAPALAQFYPPNDPNFYHNNAINARWPYQVSNAVDPNVRVGNTSVHQVNITGATLFRDFFELSSSTNDFIDADRDGCKGFNPPDPNCPIVDYAVG